MPKIFTSFIILIYGSVFCQALLHKAELMTQWLKREGAIINPKVAIEVLPNIGYGLRATEAIAQGEEVCQIPQHVALRTIDELDPLRDLAVQVNRSF
jgi:hypothetical protein